MSVTFSALRSEVDPNTGTLNCRLQRTIQYEMYQLRIIKKEDLVEKKECFKADSDIARSVTVQSKVYLIWFVMPVNGKLIT